MTRSRRSPLTLLVVAGLAVAAITAIGALAPADYDIGQPTSG